MRFNLKTALAIILTALGVGLLVSYFLVVHPALTSRMNNIVYDLWLTLQTRRETNPAPVIIDIDEKSIKNIGQWPWSRTILADLVTTLLYEGVAAIGLDIWLTEPDRSSPIAVDSQLEKNFGLNLDFTNIPTAALDNDRYFRDQIAGKPVITGAFASFDNKEPPIRNLPESLDINEKTTSQNGEFLKGLIQTDGLLAPLPIFADVTPIGLLNVKLDEDGQVRSMPFLIRIGEKIYPGLALRTLMTVLGEKTITLIGKDGELSGLKVGEYEIPLEKDGTFRPLYKGVVKTFPHYSAVDILDGKVEDKDLAGKIVFIGPSAHSMNMLQSTPLDPAFPETEIHATIIDNILSGSFITIPPYAKKLLFTACFLAAFLGAMAFYLFSLPIYVSFAFLLAASLVCASWFAFQQGLFLSPVSPLFALFGTALVILPFRYWHEQAEKRKLKKAFNQYVSPEVVSRIINEGEHLLRGEQKEVSILFTDIRNFTAISERLAPNQLVRLLNFYFTPITACVTARQGTLDKFIGDALMAFWNAPIDIERHSLKAVLAAFDMQRALTKLRPEIMREFGVELKMGIGINSGLVHVGNMGSMDLLDYTCIGENVNLASRLEGMCKRYGFNIVISSSIKDACDTELDHLLLDRISVKGSDRPLEIYTPLDPILTRDKKMEQEWLYALELYFNGEFMKAEDAFHSLQKYEYLKTASFLFMERCTSLKNLPLADWKGVWKYDTK